MQNYDKNKTFDFGVYQLYDTVYKNHLGPH